MTRLKLHEETPSPNFRQFIADMRQAIELKGVQWDMPLDVHGRPLDGHDWDLRALNGSHQRHAAGTGGFGIDAGTRELAMQRGRPGAAPPASPGASAPGPGLHQAPLSHPLPTWPS